VAYILIVLILTVAFMVCAYYDDMEDSRRVERWIEEQKRGRK